MTWVTLCCMWGGASLTGRLVDDRPRGAIDQPVPARGTFGAGSTRSG